MEVIHSDVCGPFPLSVGGPRNFVTLYEKRSGVIMATPMARKSDVGMALRTNFPILERMSGKKCQRIRTDGAKEYKSARLVEWYADKGIVHEETLLYCPESNGAAERINRRIKERARAVLAEKGVNDSLWAEALVASVYVINRSPKAGQDVTQWEALTGNRPDVSSLRVWGGPAYALKHAKQQKGLQFKTNAGIMVGYGRSGQGYRVYLPDQEQIVERRDVTMDETDTRPAKKDAHVHWSDDADSGDGVAMPTGEATPGDGRTLVLTPLSSGASSSTGNGIEAAIDAARRLAGTVHSDADSDDEEELVARYPARLRLPPARLGAGSHANAAVADG
eukprot:contig_5326_g1186